MKYALLLAVASLLIAAGRVQADDSLPPELRGVGIEQRLDQQVPLDLAFRDEFGRRVHLGDLLHGKPTILELAYFRCPRLCNEVLNGLLTSLKELPSFDVGDKFNVLTVSFDARETPELALAKRQSALDFYGRPGAEDGWHFLTGTQLSIDRLTAAVGFHVNYDAPTDQFAHAAGIMVLTPDGKVARYFYGIDYPSRDLRLALVEASAGKIGSPVDQILLFCFHYDSATGRYTASVMNLVRLAGIVTVAAVGLLWAWLVRRGKSERATIVAEVR